MPCQSCRRDVPTRPLKLHRSISLIMMNSHSVVEAPLCRRCSFRYFWEYTLVTCVVGWWGLLGIVTPFLLVSNLLHYIRSRRLPDGAPYSIASASASASPITRPMQCPACQSYPITILPLGKVVLASMIGAPILAVLSVYLIVRSIWVTNDCFGILGILGIGSSLLALISTIMLLRNRQWVCSVCGYNETIEIERTERTIGM